MRKRTLLSTVTSLAAVLSLCFSAASYGETAGEKRIAEIKIQGNSAVSTTTILSRLKIKPGDIFEESALNKELKRLYAMGYFADVFVETEERTEGISIKFTVVEKPAVGKIVFRGNNRIKEGKLSKKVSIKEGDMLDFNVLSQDVSEITKHYTEEGYGRIKIDYKIEDDPETGKATVVFVIDEGLPIKIKSIKFEGNKAIPNNELEKYMSTKTEWWFIRKGAFEQEKFESDLERIKTLYRTKGYLDVRIETKLEYSENGEELFITVIVDEQRQYLVGDMTVSGELTFPEQAIREKIKLKSGDAFDYGKIKEDIEEIRAEYYRKGYMNAEIDLGHKYNPSTQRMDIKYDIKSHEEVYVGKINVLGNTKTKDKIVRRELRVYPGEIYDGDKIKKSKERIYNLGFFEDVYFETVPSDQKNVKDLNVTVKETKTGEFSFGGGYSSVDAFIGFVQIRQKNFDILNFPTFTGSGQDLVLRGELGSARSNYLLSWTDPWIFDYPLLFGFDVYRQEHQKFGTSGYDYDERHTGGSLRLGKDLTDNLKTGLIYNLEEVKISDVPDDSSQDLKDEEGENMVSRMTWNMEYDTRDNIFSPTKGLVSGIAVENAGGFVGGDKDFVKLYGHSAFYFSIFDTLVLELKGRSGIVENYGDTKKVPIYDRFFAGGARTIRGYKERAVGPRDSANTGLPVGGEAMVIGNAELVFPIFKNIIKGAVFYDIGNVMETYTDIFTDTAYKMGTGVGLRVKTPIGPIKLDYGYPLSDNHNEKKEGQFYFSVSHGF